MECHGNTLLPQFLGMYRLTVDGVETYMVVTRNVFSHRLTVHRKYDLKVRPWGEAGSSSGTVGVGSGNPSLVGFAQGIEVLGGCGWSSNVGPFPPSQEITKRGLSTHFKNAFVVFLHGEI